MTTCDGCTKWVDSFLGKKESPAGPRRRFRPCIDLHGGVVKQIVGATLVDGETPTTNFEAKISSAEFAKMYQKDGLYGGHVIMLGPGNEEASLAALSAFPGGMHVGGGINPVNASKFLEAGASHVIVTSYVFRDGKIDYDRLKEMVDAVGKERLVLDLSCRRREGGSEYYVVTDRWQKFTDFVVCAESLQRLAQECDEFLVHGVDVEGLQSGIEEDLVALLGEHSPLPVTYAGGARTFEDLRRVERLGKGRVDLTIGSALDIFGGELSFSEVVEFCKA